MQIGVYLGRRPRPLEFDADAKAALIEQLRANRKGIQCGVCHNYEAVEYMYSTPALQGWDRSDQRRYNTLYGCTHYKQSTRT